MKEEGLIPKEEDPEETEKYFAAWINQPVAKDLPGRPIFIDDAGFEFQAVILGCSFVAKGSDPSSVHIAESLFAALEAFLATSLEDVQPHVERVNIHLDVDDSLANISINLDRSSGEPFFAVKYPSSYSLSAPAEREAFKDWLVQVVTEVILNCMMMKDAEGHLTRLARDERVFSRTLYFLRKCPSVLFAEMSIGIENILGTKAKIRFEDWIPDKPDSALSILRSEPWYKPAPEKRKTPSEKFGEGAPPTEFDDLGKFGHRDRRVFSIIDVPLWNRAKWDGAAYLCYGPTYPPLLGIMFGDEEAGRQIFEAWRKRFGAFDRDDEIRLAILTGFDRSNPNHYRVAIGPNINRVDMRSENYSLWLHEFRQ